MTKMQTVETLNEGLKRGYTLTIAAKEIAERVDAEVAKAAPQVRMPGFRPGKVPANLIKKMHGEAIHGDALNAAIQEGVQKMMADNALRPAMSPSVELVDGYEQGKDAEIKVELEVLPAIPTPQIDSLVLERLTVEAGGSELDEAIERLASSQKSYDDAPKSHKAKQGDLVVMTLLARSMAKRLTVAAAKACRLKSVLVV